MKQLKKVYVEITNKCNLNCSFCHKTRREIKEMSADFFEKVIIDIKPHTDYIYMHIMGEPLCHSNLGELLDICEKHSIKVNITTNGTLIKEVANKLINKKAIRQINYSLHSLGGNENIDFNEYIKNIFSFIKTQKPENKVINCFRLWNLKKNIDNKKNAVVLELLKKEYNYQENINEKVTDRNGVKLSDNVYIQQSYEFTWPDINGKELYYEGTCFGLKSHVGILCDGSVVPCCLDCEGDMVLGNINNDSFTEILMCKRAENIVKGFRNKKRVEKLCKTCGWSC